MTAPAPAPPVERKVKWMGIWAFVASTALLGVLEAIGADPDLIAPLPVWAEAPLLAVLPTIVVLVAGYVTSHTPRPDLPMAKR